MQTESPRPQPKPWPMATVAVVIVVCITLYTAVTLSFRKPGQAYEPFDEGRRRQETQRLVEAGWQRFPAEFVSEKIPPVSAEAPTENTSAQLPALTALRTLLLEELHLPIGYSRAQITAQSDPASRTIFFEAELDGARAQIVGFEVFRKGSDVLLLPRWQGAGESHRAAEGKITFTTAPLPEGASYRVLLPALKSTTVLTLTR